ncbi:hypothetical protein, partial [Microbacterium gubbeenense]|uniref:hypothetical protein n=1 Tax=Microbacterium gubbeenense TaxID=159896 RepID=UPI00048D2EAC
LATAHQRITELEQQLHHALNEPIHNSNDPRLTHILNRAGHIADTLNLCTDYDRVLEKLGAPPRIREWTTTHYATITLTINTTTDATTPEEAERTAENRLTRTRILEELEKHPHTFNLELELENTEQQH